MNPPNFLDVSVPVPAEDWRVLSLDVWGNAHDGWEINDVFATGIFISLPQHATDEEIVRALKDAGEIKKTVRIASVEIEGDEDVIYIGDARDGRPVLQLQRRF